MNVKMLFFPLAITIALAVSIFYVKPEIDTLMTTRDALVKKEAFSLDVAQKVQNIQNLESSLASNKENEKTVLSYLPNTRDDDRIVDNVNFLAAQAGLALTSVKISKGEDSAEIAALLEAESTPPVGSDIIFSQTSDITALSAIPVVKIFPKFVTVSVEAIGSYEGIRDAVGKLSHEDRFQNFTEVNIERMSTTETQPAEGESKDASVPASDVLKATFSMDFHYLPKVNAKGNFNQPILNQSQFEFGLVSKLKEYTSSTVPAVSVETAGVSNPFLR